MGANLGDGGRNRRDVRPEGAFYLPARAIGYDERMAKRFQIPLYKLFVVTAVYAVAIGLSSRFGDGWQWHGVALMVGTVTSILVCIATADNLFPILETGFWILLCASGMIFGAGPLLAADDTDDSWAAKSSFLIATAIGVCVRGLLSFLFQRLRKSQAIFLDDSRPNSDPAD
jgi:hypothetical protein